MSWIVNFYTIFFSLHPLSSLAIMESKHKQQIQHQKKYWLSERTRHSYLVYFASLNATESLSGTPLHNPQKVTDRGLKHVKTTRGNGENKGGGGGRGGRGGIVVYYP